MTGEIVREVSHIPVINVWRLSDGSTFLINNASSEPAGGSMFWVASDQAPATPEMREQLRGPGGWYAEPSPAGPFVAITSGSFEVTSPDRSVRWHTFNGPASSFGTAPAWSWDLSRLFALVENYGEGPRHLAIAEIDNDWFHTIELPWWNPNTYEGGLAMTTDGTLVSFEVSLDDYSGRGVVFNPDGTFVREFPIEDGANLGGIDPTGNFLIYVDGNGVVRWRDLKSNTGVLGEGFFTASW